MQFLRNDKSKDKEGSHLRIKSENMQNEKFLLENSFTEKDFLQLCQIYNVNISSQKRIDAIVTELNKIILRRDCITCRD